jgi:phage tail sheath gpL-like
MPISFDNIPDALRTPGVYIEFNAELAAQSEIQQRILFIGQRLATGSVAAATPVRVSRISDARAYFGAGSMLSEMLRHALPLVQGQEVWAIALDDDPADTAATGTIEFLGAPTEPGTVAISIAGRRVEFAVTAGMTAAAVADAFRAALLGGEFATDPAAMIGAANGVNPAITDLTARMSGEIGEGIELRVHAPLPAGLTATTTGPNFGAGAVDVGSAIAAMGDEWWNWIVCPYTDAVNLPLMRQELDRRWGPLVQQGARMFAALRGEYADTTSALDVPPNSAHISILATGLAPQPPWVWAGVNAAVAARSLSIDPARPLQRLELPGLLPADVAARFIQAERNTLLYSGLATHTVGADGRVRIERQITTYTADASGAADSAYLDINTPETLERIRYAQRTLFAQKYPRHKLAADDARVGAGQAVMQPKIARAELLALYRDFEEGGWTQDYEGYKESLIVEIDATDPSRLNVLDSPKLVGQYRVHAMKTQFRR